MGELAQETVFIDGTKLDACANKYTFVWKKFISKWEEKMFQKIQEAVQLLNQEYMHVFVVAKETCSQDLKRLLDFLKGYCEQHAVVSVYGRGKRKSIHQKYRELFSRFLDRQLLYDLHHYRFGGRNNYSKTDVDATFMYMKDDHMRNDQLKPGYNVQIGVDSEYIVAADIFQDRNDVWTLVLFLKHMEENLDSAIPAQLRIPSMKAKKVTAICGKRNRYHISSLRPMRYRRSGVLRRTSANGRTWDMMKAVTVILAMSGQKGTEKQERL